jgi:hypothetical protein
MKRQNKIRKNNLIKRKKNLLVFANKILFALIFAFGVAYIGTVNDLSIKGFVISELEKKTSELSALNQNLELDAMLLGSYEAISAKAESLKMVKNDKIEYLDVSSGPVAKR